MPVQPSPPLPPNAERVMRTLGLSASRLWVLVYLNAHPDSSTAQIAEESDMNRASVLRVVTKLVDAGLVLASEDGPRVGRRVTYRVNEEAVQRELEDLWRVLLPRIPPPPGMTTP